MWSYSPIALPYQNIQEFHIDDYVPPTLEFKETAPCVGPAIVVPIATGAESDESKEPSNAAAAPPPKKRGRPKKKARADGYFSERKGFLRIPFQNLLAERMEGRPIWRYLNEHTALVTEKSSKAATSGGLQAAAR